MKTFLVLAQSSHYGQNVDLVILSKEGDHTHITRVSVRNRHSSRSVVAPTITLPRAIAEMVRERL